MSKVRRFFSRSVLVIGGLIGASLPIYFSFAQNYGPIESELINRVLSFVMPDRSVYLYAVTEPNTYTIYFDGNGSTA